MSCRKDKFSPTLRNPSVLGSAFVINHVVPFHFLLKWLTDLISSCWRNIIWPDLSDGFKLSGLKNCTDFVEDDMYWWSAGFGFEVPSKVGQMIEPVVWSNSKRLGSILISEAVRSVSCLHVLLRGASFFFPLTCFPCFIMEKSHFAVSRCSIGLETEHATYKHTTCLVWADFWTNNTY